MRVRAIAAAAAVAAVVLIPTVASAQIRLPGRRGVSRPAPLPPQAPTVAREMRYVRLPLSIESYQLVSYFDSPGLTAGAPYSTWMSFGLGTRLDYRIAKYLSATFDMTSSVFGGPVLTQTGELGLRLRRDRGEHRFYPFLDVRGGYLFALNSRARMMDFAPGSDAQTFGFAGGYNDGFGAIGGAGMEFALTRQFSVTTLASAVSANMTAHEFDSSNPLARNHFPMRAYRYALGLRWNPVRALTQPPAVGGMR